MKKQIILFILLTIIGCNKNADGNPNQENDNQNENKYKLGEFVIQPQFDQVPIIPENGLIAARIGNAETGKWGFINQAGEWVIQPKFDGAGNFANNGLAKVRIGNAKTGKWGFINQSGEWVIQPKFDDVTDFFSGDGITQDRLNGLAEARIGNAKTGKWGFINKTGEWVIQPKFNIVEDSAENGLAGVRIGDDDVGEWGFIWVGLNKKNVPKKSEDKENLGTSKSSTTNRVNTKNQKFEPIFLKCSVKRNEFSFQGAKNINVDFQIRHAEAGWELGLWESPRYEFHSSFIDIDGIDSRVAVGNVTVSDDAIVIEAAKDAPVIYIRQVISRYDGSWSWYYDTGRAVRAYRESGLCNASKDRSLSKKFNDSTNE